MTIFKSIFQNAQEKFLCAEHKVLTYLFWYCMWYVFYVLTY